MWDWTVPTDRPDASEAPFGAIRFVGCAAALQVARFSGRHLPTETAGIASSACVAQGTMARTGGETRSAP